MCKQIPWPIFQMGRVAISFFIGIAVAACGTPQSVGTNAFQPESVYRQGTTALQQFPSSEDRDIRIEKVEEVGSSRTGEERDKAIDPASNVFFSTGSVELSAESLSVIHSISIRLKANPRMKVLLVGYTDHLGSKEYSMALASKRTNAVRAELLKQGVRIAQIRKLSHGNEVSPQHGCNSEACRRTMRRVEFQLSGDEGSL